MKIDREALNRQIEGNVRVGLILAGKGIVELVRASMAASGGGRTYKTKFGIHTASGPGMPPAPQTWRLHDSIAYHTNFGDSSPVGPRADKGDKISKPKRAMGGYVVSIGSNVPYALSLEKGNRVKKTAARPYLWPALKKSREIIKEAFDRA